MMTNSSILHHVCADNQHNTQGWLCPGSGRSCLIQSFRRESLSELLSGRFSASSSSRTAQASVHWYTDTTLLLSVCTMMVAHYFNLSQDTVNVSMSLRCYMEQRTVHLNWMQMPHFCPQHQSIHVFLYHKCLVRQTLTTVKHVCSCIRIVSSITFYIGQPYVCEREVCVRYRWRDR